MLTIKLNQNWRLRSDGIQWIVERCTGTRKKRHSKGFEANWEKEAYIRSTWQALHFIIDRQIKLMEGEFPPSALKPMFETLNEIETMLESLKERLDRCDSFHDKAPPSPAKVILEEIPPLPTPANENTPEPKKKTSGEKES